MRYKNSIKQNAFVDKSKIVSKMLIYIIKKKRYFDMCDIYYTLYLLYLDLLINFFLLILTQVLLEFCFKKNVIYSYCY